VLGGTAIPCAWASFVNDKSNAKSASASVSHEGTRT